MAIIHVLLGSNEGPSLEFLAQARRHLSERVGILRSESMIYRSEPWGFEAPQWFLNQAVALESSLSAREALTVLLDIEKQMGRQRMAEGGYASRCIDLDILYWDDSIVDEPDLQIPHPRMHDRRFVLLPLSDIAPDKRHPRLGKSTKQLLDECTDQCMVRPSSHLYPYIAIEGVIGVGKSSLATMLAEAHGAKVVLENFENNPFLPKFYAEPEKYAFPVELSFLAERFQQLQEYLPSPDLFHNQVITDYITEKSLIFAGKTLPEDVFTLYAKLFHIIFSNLPKPSLLVYLYAKPEKLKENILRRGRDYEQNISLDYLAKLQEGYLEHFKYLPQQRILVIDTNELDFVHCPEHFLIIQRLIYKDYPLGLHYV